MKTAARSIEPLTTLPTWATLIKETRRRVQENQTTFGARFGVTQSAVALWELGKNDPPARVLMWAIAVWYPTGGREAQVVAAESR